MISVCMSAYNGEKYIYRQIKSILDQLKRDDELIIYDDASVDKTLDIIKSFYDPRIRLITGEENVGFLKGFQCAMEQAKGEYIFLSDQDDLWMPNKVDLMMQYFERCNCDCIVHDAVVVNDDMKVLHESLFALRGCSSRALRNFVKNTITGACMAFRADMRQYILPFPDNISYHDRWIAIVLGIRKKQICIITEKLICYVRHTGTVTNLISNKITRIMLDRLVLGIEIVKYLKSM